MKTKITIIAMCLGIFVCMLDTTVMNITLPAIQKNLTVDLGPLSWALNIYTIVFAVFTIPLSRLAEIKGRNKVYIVGLLLFGIGSIGCGLSANIQLLVGFRAVQSIGAAIVFPTSMTIGISGVRIEKRTNVIAALGVTQGLSAALGPTVGGAITQFFGWRWVFFINIPIIFLSIILCFCTFSFKDEEKIRSRIDYLGSLYSMVMLFNSTLVLVKGRDWGWNSITTLSLLSMSIIAGIFFIKHEKRTRNPMIPLALFKDRQFISSSINVILSNVFLIGVTVILPTFLTKIQRESEFYAALLITPISMMIFIFSPISALLLKRLGSRVVMFIGFFAMAISYYSFSILNVDTNYYQLLVTCSLLGFGYGTIVGPITVLSASDFEEDMLTASQSVTSVFRQVGIVLAVAIFVSALTSNILFAKQESLKYADRQIQTLTGLPENKKQEIFRETKKQVMKEKDVPSPKQHISQKEKKNELSGNIRSYC